MKDVIKSLLITRAAFGKFSFYKQCLKQLPLLDLDFVTVEIVSGQWENIMYAIITLSPVN